MTTYRHAMPLLVYERLLRSVTTDAKLWEATKGIFSDRESLRLLLAEGAKIVRTGEGNIRAWGALVDRVLDVMFGEAPRKMEIDVEGVTVGVGQKWVDKDPRRGRREVTVKEILPTGDFLLQAESTGLKTRVRADRFIRRYVFVSQPSEQHDVEDDTKDKEKPTSNWGGITKR